MTIPSSVADFPGQSVEIATRSLRAEPFNAFALRLA